MNKPYWGLWTLLLVAFALFAALSFWSDGFNAVDIKTSSFGRTMEGLFADNDSTASGSDSLDASGRLPNGRHPEGWRAPMDTTAKSILFIGDSMLEGLGERLAAYCDKNGHKLVEVIWYSSSTLCWGETARLTKLINEYQPNYIMVCLGANELYVPDIKNARRPHLKKILKEIGDIPYLFTCGLARPTGLRIQVSTTCWLRRSMRAVSTIVPRTSLPVAATVPIPRAPRPTCGWTVLSNG